MTQKEMVLKHLKQHKAITSWQAFEIYGITRLSDIIYKLRRDHTIVATLQKKKNRYGNNVNFSKYELKE